MNNIHKMTTNLTTENQLSPDKIPNIDLYMDQVIQLFENQYENTKRNPKEKVLTKTMINNYAKGKLLFPIKNKKYTRNHLMLISMIYQLKGSLSIKDVKTTLDVLNHKIESEDVNLEQVYQGYLNTCNLNEETFRHHISANANAVKEEAAYFADDHDTAYLEHLLMIASFVHMGNLYRKIAEKLVDELDQEKED